jgi:hypothetical protein
MTADELRALLIYDPLTGKLYWRVRSLEYFTSERSMKRWNTRYAGKMALDATGPRGTRIGAIHGKTVTAHRVAWCIYYGAWPENEIDHWNNMPSDNWITNLRDATRPQNCQNKTASGASRFLGVSFHKASNKWTAQINLNGKRRYLGLFRSEREAAVKYDSLASVFYGKFANLNSQQGSW